MSNKRHYTDNYFKHKRQCINTQDNLPILKCKNDFLTLLESKQIVVITGETGCGKSTQIPKYLVEAGYSSKGRIVCTQPRRIAAISLANRVAEELKCDVGDKVGYSIRFDKCVNDSTSIVYMTDGVLLRELQTDSNLLEYSVIIIDEAHERSIQTDALLGIMKHLLKMRPSLKLIISSATINIEKFVDYYNASIFRIVGRIKEVKIVYSKSKGNDYIDDIVNKVIKIHCKNIAGDVLIFLPGREDIGRCIEAINKKKLLLDPNLPYVYIFPAYSSLTKSQLCKIFKPISRNARKIIVATNIAETSITIEGITFVIDSGFVKQKTYNSFLGIDQLLLTVISRSQADQRAGRAGRTSNGKCYRMYSSSRYNKMMPSALPEIQRANLANTVLQLKSIGIEDVTKFDFIDPPDSHRLMEAIKELVDMSALSIDGRLTVLGRYMAQLPLDPILSKILIMSSYRQCSEEILIIVSMLCVKSIFDKSSSEVKKVERQIQHLQQHQGDHITYLYIFIKWKENNFSEQWCKENFCRYSSLKQAQNIRNQLQNIMERSNLEIISCDNKIVDVQNTLSLYYFRRNAAHKDRNTGYRTLCDNQIVFIHPSSALFRRQPEWVVFHDVMETSNKYILEVTKIHASFIRDLLPNIQ